MLVCAHLVGSGWPQALPVLASLPGVVAGSSQLGSIGCAESVLRSVVMG